MDSLTQLTLGAAVGEAVLGRKVGRKAMLWGAVCGTFPDLDVLIPFSDPIKFFTYHRSFSHSIFVLSLLTPLFVWLILKLHPQVRLCKKEWIWLVWLVFMTHILLDCFTVYGTQVFWPISNYPVGWATIFIIDPLYTVPLLAGVVLALILTRKNDRGHLLNQVGLAVSTLYLVWSVGAKLYVASVVEETLVRQGVRYEQLLVSAGPFNTALWRMVVMLPDGNYYEGFYSLLDGYDDMTLQRYESRPALLGGIRDERSVRRLQWFSKGYYKVWVRDDKIVISDLRMGYEPDYVFSFVVGTLGNSRVKPAPIEQLQPKRDLGRLKKAWSRIWAPGAV